ncbi:hypothetical protein ABFU27_00340 [Xanthomonas campestris pv. raphani]|uniref:hypothetical protein n=1 Tax=Xanthomonas campestris TaxID=339 RepID=UPI00388D6BEB
MSSLAGGLAGWSEGEYLASYHRAALAHTTSMTRFRLLTLFLFLVLFSMLPSACARSSEETAGDVLGVHPMAAKSPAAHVAAKAVTNGVNTPMASISNQELEARLLQFVDAFKVPEDMSYARFESALGIKLGPASEPASPWHVVKDIALADGYTFYATHFPAEKGFRAWKSLWLCQIQSTQRARRHPSAFGTRQRSRRDWRQWVINAAGSALSRRDGYANTGAPSATESRASRSHC